MNIAWRMTESVSHALLGGYEQHVNCLPACRLLLLSETGSYVADWAVTGMACCWQNLRANTRGPVLKVFGITSADPKKE
jgi:hypothetical protein